MEMGQREMQTGALETATIVRVIAETNYDKLPSRVAPTGHRRGIKARVLDPCYIGLDFGCNSVCLFPDAQNISPIKSSQELNPNLTRKLSAPSTNKTTASRDHDPGRWSWFETP